jgi:lipoprotein-releasing system permease protein
MSDGFNGIDIRCKSDIYSKKMKNDLESIYRNIGTINSWEDQHTALVQAMKLEKKAAVLVLSLIIVVACFNLISNLILIIRQKWRELGILQVIGYSKRNIKRIVFNQGMLLGCLGCIAGTLMGGVLVWFQSRMGILPLPEDVYFMESLPMNLSIYEFIFVPTVAIFFVSGASYLAAKRAVLITPINAIKLEK